MNGGRLPENIMHFGRVLRTAGLPVGPDQVLKAIEAVSAVDMADRAQFYWALHAALVNRRGQQELFDQAFHIFWRNPRLLERMMSLVIPTSSVDTGPEESEPLARRLAEALTPQESGIREREGDEEVEIRAELTWSDREVLRAMDFETMSLAEQEAAKRAMAKMRLPLRSVPARRFRLHPRGRRPDLRATLRGAMRTGGDFVALRRRRRLRRPPPLVVICDISGSMARYSRMLLHFMHAVTNDRDRVHCFLFGTRLTNVTRQLRQKDVDTALAGVADAVEDWSGGTRIGASLRSFNRLWSRRVLGQGAVVLLISDGLDRDSGEGLAVEIERLHKSCRRLVWLNPLLRYDGYEPRTRGAAALMPHVDEFRPAHNLDSLEELAAALGREPARRQEGVSEWLTRL
ncbi:MAG: VWA domain-containing protein [Alphaproteobacteria bacterium]|nr:VWA domain-containing protein [Alphaproteobacteria bacterium]